MAPTLQKFINILFIKVLFQRFTWTVELPPKTNTDVQLFDSKTQFSLTLISFTFKIWGGKGRDVHTLENPSGCKIRLISRRIHPTLQSPLNCTIHTAGTLWLRQILCYRFVVFSREIRHIEDSIVPSNMSNCGVVTQYGCKSFHCRIVNAVVSIVP